jgi:diacylglycerol kinase
MRGVSLAFRHDWNMTIHLISAITVIVVNYLLDISRTDWVITLLLTGIVWMSEMFNTSIERLADRITRDEDPMIGQVKDLAAGAVLIIGLTAVVCAAIVYWPYVHDLVKNLRE